MALKADYRTETLAVLGEYHKNASSPFMKLEEALNGTAFTKHTYRHTTMGYLADVKAMPEAYDYSQQFFHRYYTPDNCVIFVVGDFDPAAVLTEIQAQYGGWTGHVATPNIPMEPPQKGPREAHIDWPTPTLPRLIYGFKVPAASDWRADAAQDVLFSYLFGETSPLYKDLVLDRQLCEPFQPWTGPHRDPFLFAVLVAAKHESALPEIEKSVDAALAAVAAGRIDADRLAKIKSNRHYGTGKGHAVVYRSHPFAAV